MYSMIIATDSALRVCGGVKTLLVGNAQLAQFHLADDQRRWLNLTWLSRALACVMGLLIALVCVLLPL